MSEASESTDRLETVLAQMIERALGGVDAIVDFSQQQIPIVIEQLLTWHFIEALVTGLLMFVLLPIWLGICYRFRPGVRVDPNDSGFHRNTRPNLFTDRDNDGDPRLLFTGITTISVVICFFSSFSYLLTAVKITVAPKLYLLEYGASLVK